MSKTQTNKLSLDECKAKIKTLEQELLHTQQMLKAEETIRRILERDSADATTHQVPALGKSKSATILVTTSNSPNLNRKRKDQIPKKSDVCFSVLLKKTVFYLFEIFFKKQFHFIFKNILYMCFFHIFLLVGKINKTIGRE